MIAQETSDQKLFNQSSTPLFFCLICPHPSPPLKLAPILHAQSNISYILKKLKILYYIDLPEIPGCYVRPNP